MKTVSAYLYHHNFLKIANDKEIIMVKWKLSLFFPDTISYSE